MMQMQTMFVYRPKAGDRVFAERAAPGMAVVKWGNGCRHVVGGVHMEWYAAAPGSWWRRQAKTLAEEIVGSVGGIAWDDQGAIRLIVPVGVAARVRALMCAGEAHMTSSSETEQDALKRDAALIMAGYRPAEGRLDIGASGLFVAERPVIEKAAADTIAPKAYVWFFGPAPSKDAARPTIASVTAPSTWGPPEVLMPPGAEEVKHTVLSPAPEEAPGARPELADG